MDKADIKEIPKLEEEIMKTRTMLTKFTLKTDI